LGALGDNVPEVKETTERALGYLTRSEGPWIYNGKTYTTKSATIYAFLDDEKAYTGDVLFPTLETARKNLPFPVYHGDFHARVDNYCNKTRTDQTGQYTISRPLLKSGKCGRVYTTALITPENKEGHDTKKEEQRKDSIQDIQQPSISSI
jgi:hypothetical protein